MSDWPGTWPISTRCIACRLGLCDICVQLETPERFCGCLCPWVTDPDDPRGGGAKTTP